jgi:GxxExxY protein
MKSKLIRQDLLYPELSYSIVGCAYAVYNELGPGHDEKTYKNALVVEFQKRGISFVKEYYGPAKYNGVVVRKRFHDFLIEDKIIVEVKKTNLFARKNIEQVVQYLNICEKKLALLINFGADKVYVKRVPNGLNTPDQNKS